MGIDQQDRETCQSKTAYASKEDAQEAGHQARRVGKNIREYKCKVCGCWHLTKAVKEKPKSPLSLF